MEGRTRITLLALGIETRGAFGEVSTSAVEHERRALRTDRAGRRTFDANTELGEWSRQYEVRSAGLSPDTDWLLRDEDDGGRLFTIESVSRPVGRSRKLLLRVKSRS